MKKTVILLLLTMLITYCSNNSPTEPIDSTSSSLSSINNITTGNENLDSIANQLLTNSDIDTSSIKKVLDSIEVNPENLIKNSNDIVGNYIALYNNSIHLDYYNEVIDTVHEQTVFPIDDSIYIFIKIVSDTLFIVDKINSNFYLEDKRVIVFNEQTQTIQTKSILYEEDNEDENVAIYKSNDSLQIIISTKTEFSYILFKSTLENIPNPNNLEIINNNDDSNYSSSHTNYPPADSNYFPGDSMFIPSDSTVPIPPEVDTSITINNTELIGTWLYDTTITSTQLLNEKFSQALTDFENSDKKEHEKYVIITQDSIYITTEYQGNLYIVDKGKYYLEHNVLYFGSIFSPNPDLVPIASLTTSQSSFSIIFINKVLINENLDENSTYEEAFIIKDQTTYNTTNDIIDINTIPIMPPDVMKTN